ncbi:transposase zinc-binding domain-containing protein [Desulfosporosinus shakirovi]|uniref:transposase zinc-binding domain-containing protein n=1 Tax=Desulfosporosinus shakirovi TaxID=2885154 RepID=UPI001E314D71|nr:transposase zinc-binding domain-containing protein [Desulfosporosinus sp. SRJS8]MCB8817873.1 transposase zinc-binding domain-containing protein [Desulfosporosinus sp. SRJS8]
MARGIIKQIFTEQWEKFEANNKVRDIVSEEINKMLKCRDLSEGYSEYRCPTCGERKYVAFKCKSRFCTSWGKKATDDWVENLCHERLDVPHRHMVFTIPEELRIVFLRDRKIREPTGHSRI